MKSSLCVLSCELSNNGDCMQVSHWMLPRNELLLHISRSSAGALPWLCNENISLSCDAHLIICQVDIDTVEKFEALRETEKQYFLDMVKKCKDSGATLIICQWHALAS